MSLPQLAVRRPVATTVVVCLLVLLGTVSLFLTPVDLLPKLEIPMVVVSTEYGGAGPREVETMVTEPIEEAVGAVANVTRVSSASSDGRSLVVAEFSWGTNMDVAVQDVRDKVELVTPFLPSGTGKPLIIRADPSLMPVVRVGFSGSADLAALTRIAEDVVKPALERLDGVAAVEVEGGIEEEVQVLVDPARLQGYGVSLSQVVQALRLDNLNLPGGSVEVSGKKASVRSVAEFTRLEDVGDVLLPTQAGSAVFVRDVAEVREGQRDPEEIVRLDGRPSVTLAVQKQSGANTVQVSRAVRAALARTSAQMPAGVRLVILEDQARFIEQSIRNTVDNAWQGGLLAALVLLAFLQSFPSTLVIAVSMPVSIIATFFFMYSAGVGLNMMSLGGLALGVGMLVDNSIVVLESIFRHQAAGKAPNLAAVDGAREVGTAISASTFTTIVVFLPILFIKGFAAELFRELGLTVSFALLVSLAVALTVIPMAASRTDLRASSAPLAAGVRSRLEALNTFYRGLLSWALGNRKKVVATAIGCMVLAAALFPAIGFEFIPEVDQRQVSVEIEAPEGTPLARTDRVVAEAEKILLETPERESILATTGGGGTFGLSPAGNRASLTLRLKDRGRPTREVVEDLRRRLSQIPGATIRVSLAGGIAGSEHIFGAPVSVELRGDDLDTLTKLADDLARKVEQVPGTREVEKSTGEGAPELRVTVDRPRAAAFGLSPALVGATVKAAVEGEVATRYKVAGRELDVRVRLQQPYRRTLEDLEYLPVASYGGAPVPLSAVASVEQSTGPVTIERENQTRTVRVDAQIAGRTLGAVTADVRRAVSSLALPPGYSVTIGGEAEQMREAFGTLGWALLLSVVLVYMVMAVQFESLALPLVIMGAVPFSFVGVVLGLFLAGKSISTPALIGVITLGGIVVNNAIVLLDYTEQLRRSGMPRDEAVVQAGATRLRPVLMTTTTTVLGLLPMALGLGRGAEIRSPIAIVLIGGLTMSTLLTLVVVPVFYTLVDDLRRSRARRRTAQPAHLPRSS